MARPKCLSVVIVAMLAQSGHALARPFDYLAQNRTVFAEARPADGAGESVFRSAPAFDPFSESIAASWIITDSAGGVASTEAQQSSTLSPDSICAAGFSFALASSTGVFASSFSFFEVTFSLAEPTTIALNTVVGGSASVLLQGPGIDLLVIDDTRIETLDLAPGAYLLRADSTSAPEAPSEQVGSFHLAVAIVPGPGGALVMSASLVLFGRRRRLPRLSG